MSQVMLPECDVMWVRCETRSLQMPQLPTYTVLLRDHSKPRERRN